MGNRARTPDEQIVDACAENDYEQARKVLTVRGRSWNPKAQRTVRKLIDLLEDIHLTTPPDC